MTPTVIGKVEVFTCAHETSLVRYSRWAAGAVSVNALTEADRTEGIARVRAALPSDIGLADAR